MTFARSIRSLCCVTGVLCLTVLGVDFLGAPRGSQDGSVPEAPALRIVWPEDGAVLGGDVSVFVPSRGDLGVVRVELLLDGTRRVGSVPGGVYALSWNTRGLAEGPHTLTARAYDTSGRTLSSVPVRVTVGAPLTVSLASPGRGETRSGRLSLSATVAHARGTAWVQFHTEERYLCGVQGPPYTCDEPTASLPEGPVPVRAEVYDEVGNHALSEWVTVHVKSERTASTLGLTLPGVR